MEDPSPLSQNSPGLLGQIACILEASARKPGNVHRFRDFDDTLYVDFLLSAAAIAGPLDQAARLGVGATVLRAVEATRRVVATNTNLGIILLLVPLAARRDGESLDRVLGSLSLDDARDVYQAIRLAAPGGLGSVPDQDLADEPTVTLREAMRLAADRDIVARQYINGYDDVLGIGLPSLRSALVAGQPLETAIIASHLTLLAERPDTLIARKRGPDVAKEASRRAANVLEAGWPDAPANLLDDLDTWLRADGHARNPGATADLVTAALFIALRDGTIPRPLFAGPMAWSGDNR